MIEREEPKGTEDDFKQGLEEDKSLWLGARHGSATSESETIGYARDVGEHGPIAEASREVRIKGAGLTAYAQKHPSRSLQARSRGFGIGGGYERPYKKAKRIAADSDKELYGPLPHAGYYGAGIGARPFKRGQAGFGDELSWYCSQYGEKTSGFEGEG